MTITAIKQQNNNNFEHLKNRETKAHFLAAKIVAFAALLEGIIGVANFKSTGIKAARNAAGGVKTLATRVPVFIADLFGFVKFGRKYSWLARPLIVASHSYLWNGKDLTNSAYNAYSAPVTDALLIPFQKPIHFIASPIENVLVSIAKEIVPSSICSERTIRIGINHTKANFLNYLRSLAVFTLATRVCKLNIEQPKPSIKAVYGLDNLFWIGLTIGFYKIFDYLKEEISKPAIELCTPAKCVHEKEVLPSEKAEKVQSPKKPKTLAEKLQEKRAKQAAARA